MSCGLPRTMRRMLSASPDDIVFSDPAPWLLLVFVAVLDGSPRNRMISSCLTPYASSVVLESVSSLPL